MYTCMIWSTLQVHTEQNKAHIYLCMYNICLSPEYREYFQLIASTEHRLTYFGGYCSRCCAFVSFIWIHIFFSLSIHSNNLTVPAYVVMTTELPAAAATNRAHVRGEGDFASIRISQSCLSQRFLYESATGEHLQATGRYIWLAQQA